MSHKKQPFILDANLGDGIRQYLPGGTRTTVECGLPSKASDPEVVKLCQDEEAVLVTADIEFLDHFHKYQREQNRCCWGLVLLPGEEPKQIATLKRLKAGKLPLAHPNLSQFSFEKVRHCNLYVNLRANPPVIEEICNCKWAS